MSTLLALLAWLSTPVGEANQWAATVAGLSSTDCDAPLWRQPRACPERLRWSLTVIADRESVGSFADSLRWQGEHPADGWAARRIAANGAARGWLKSWCPFHQEDDAISTWSNYGLMYGYNQHRVPELGPCWPSWLLGFPRVAALASARRMLSVCLGDRPDGWCPSMVDEMRARDRRLRREAGALARERRARCRAERGAQRCGYSQSPPA